jgi:uncharacterized protein (DUF2141 family)
MFRRWLPPLTVLILALPAHAATLQISVLGVRNNHGQIYVCVFATGEGFPACDHDPQAVRHVAPASAGTMRFALDVAPGRHAVSVLHDENDNRRLDMSVLGIPREGVGVSNNPPPRWGPPRLNDSLFTVGDTGGAIDIRLVYP